MTEWDIQSRDSTCAKCRQPFADKAVYHTLLLFSADGYHRQDLCAACFPTAPRAEAVSYWQGEYKTPPPPPPEPIQKDTAESLLRKLIESKDPEHAPARYILGVMLERKRILKHRDTVHDEQGNDLLIYEHARTGESFTIPDPRLRLDQLQSIQQQVIALLSPEEEKKPEGEPAAPATGEPPVTPA